MLIIPKKNSSLVGLVATVALSPAAGYAAKKLQDVGAIKLKMVGLFLLDVRFSCMLTAFVDRRTCASDRRVG